MKVSVGRCGTILWPERKCSGCADHPCDQWRPYRVPGLPGGCDLCLTAILSPDWLEQIDDPDMWDGIEIIPDNEFWMVRRHLKRKLVAYMMERSRNNWISTTVHPVQIIAGGVLLDPYALTIGFARRFATYKRANLILRNPDRLIQSPQSTQ